MLLIGDTPKIPGLSTPSAYACVPSSTRRPSAACVQRALPLATRSEAALASLARRHGHFDFFDAYSPLCNNQTTTCSIYVPDTATVAYLDGMHLTRSGSLYLWPYLCSAVATLRGSSDRAPANFAQEARRRTSV